MLDIGVAIWCGGGVEIVPPRITSSKRLLRDAPRFRVVTAGTTYDVHTAMQIKYTTSAGSLVQPIDILRHQQFNAAGTFELG